MSKNNTLAVHIEVMGKSYTVACPEGEEQNLFASAKQVDTEMRRIRGTGKVLGSERIAVMVALNLAHELIQCRQGTSSGDGPNAHRIAKLNSDIETALQQYRDQLLTDGAKPEGKSARSGP